jgi:hypothetical protein
MIPRQRLAALLALALAHPASGCGSGSEHLGPPRRFVLADTVTLTLPVESAWVRTVESERLLLEHDGLVLRVQEVRSDAGSTSRSTESVADALSARYALGEQTGTLTHAECRFASVDGAQCLTGTLELAGVLWARRGAVLETDGHIVWVDVVGPADRAADVESWSELLSRRASVAGGV